jgi:transposase
MRYAQGGGLTAEGRRRREQVRLTAVKRFEQRAPAADIAAELRVSERSVRRWRRDWEAGGPAGLASRGQAARCRLDEEQLAALDAVLEAGPLAAGWQDQRWTLARVRDLAARRFGVHYTIPGIWYLLRRRGWSCQLGARRAIERDDGAVEVWKKETWPRVKGRRRPSAAGSSSRTGQSMRPPRSRTWARRGITPVIRVRGGGTGHVSVAGLACYRPGHRSRLIYRLHRYRGRKGETRAFTWTEYRDLLIAAHCQLPGGVIVLVWDNLPVHLRAELRAFTSAQPWLRVFQLPSYAPDLNPTEGIWSVLKRGVLANLAAASFSHLLQVIRHGLRKLQYQPGLIEGCLTGTGLSLEPAENPADTTN